MNKEAFAVVEIPGQGMQIVPVHYTDPIGMSWKDAKKALRSYYLEKAAALRDIRKIDVIRKHLKA